MIDKKFLIGGGVVLVAIFIWIGMASGPDKKEQEITENPVEAKIAQQLYEQATIFRQDNDVIKAKEAYQKILTGHSDYANIEKVQKDIEAVNMQIIFSNIPTSDTIVYEVKRGDTLGKLSKKYGTTIELIKSNNNLKNNIIRIGQKLRIWTAKFNIRVDKSQNILILKKDNEVLKVYDVSTGENNSTPVGNFKVTTRLVDPVWFNRGVVVPPESPENALGSRWLGFDIPGYGIHGTVDPETIGQQVTAGCVRMRNEEVEELYKIIPLGTKVVVVD